MLCSFLKNSTIVSAFASLIGVAKMALDVQSYIMNIAVIPCIDVIGNFPVKSAYIVPSFFIHISQCHEYLVHYLSLLRWVHAPCCHVLRPRSEERRVHDYVMY